jgi:hypothetical protein
MCCCLQCRAGYYCPFQDLDLELPCLSGTYSTGNASVCTACPVGYNCSTTRQYGRCANGYFSSESGGPCEICPAGYQCTSSDITSPVPCVLGEYAPAGSTSCTTCQPGYACSVPSATPVICTVGTYAPGGNFQCYTCPSGYSCAGSGATAPTVCAAGKYAASGAGSCTTVSAYLNHNHVLGSSHVPLLQCPGGFACPSASATPLECLLGMYATAGSAACTYCPSGYNCPTSSSSPVACTAGRYSSGGLIALECLPCDGGYWCPGAATDLIGSPLAIGSYFDPIHLNVAEEWCPVGSYGAVAVASTLVSVFMLPDNKTEVA